MDKQKNKPIAQAIQLHAKSRLLEITFSDGKRFEYPCEYLRVNSHAAEVRTLGRPVTGKELVNITQIEPQGNYAIRLIFDDGHDTGIYSWDLLYDLGCHFEQYWRAYLRSLEAINYQRSDHRPGMVKRDKVSVTILYFVQLPVIFGVDNEQVELPGDVINVKHLLAWLRARDKQHDDLLHDDMVTVTVNKQFAEPFTVLENGDEVAIVPKPD